MITRFQNSLTFLLFAVFAILLFTFSCGKNISEQKKEAEKLGADWLAALLRKDVDALTQMSDVPFLFGDRVLKEIKDVRSHYEMDLQTEEAKRFLREYENVDHLIEVQTIGELKKQEGFKEYAGRKISSLKLSDEDFFIAITFKKKERESMKLFIRKVEGKLKLAGWWD
jgi:hypothetical protein